MQTIVTLPLPPKDNALYVQTNKYRAKKPSQRYDNWRFEADRSLLGQRANTNRHVGQVKIRYEVSSHPRIQDILAYEEALEKFLVSRKLVSSKADIGFAAMQWSNDLKPDEVRVTIETLDDKYYYGSY